MVILMTLEQSSLKHFSLCRSVSLPIYITDIFHRKGKPQMVNVNEVCSLKPAIKYGLESSVEGKLF